MAPSKTSKNTDSLKENPSTRKATSSTQRSQSRDFNEKDQPESSSKADHHIHLPHLPHIPHPHLHHQNEKSISSPNPLASHKPRNNNNNNNNNKTKPPSTHANIPPTLPKTSTSTTHTNTSTTTTATATKRPTPLRRQTSIQTTRYITMLLDLDTIPRLHNILASFFTWILLAGYIVFPGTFTSLQDSSSSTTNPQINNSKPAEEVLKGVKNAPLLWIAGFCCGIGAVGMLWLWWRWRRNFVWLINRIFLPATLNSLAGLISTLINVYTQQGRAWSISAKVTAIVSGTCTVILALLFFLYNFWALRRVKRRHGREMREGEVGEGGGAGAGVWREGGGVWRDGGVVDGGYGNGEGNGDARGIVGMMQRKAREPGLEPGSVV